MGEGKTRSSKDIMLQHHDARPLAMATTAEKTSNIMDASNFMGASNSMVTSSNSMGASNSMNKGKSMDITNSTFIIISKGVSNSREANNEDVENIALKFIVNLNGRSGAMVEYSVDYLKVEGLRPTSA